MTRFSYVSIKLRNAVLILLLLIAFSLRLYRLDHQEIWGDEAHSAYVASLPLLSAVSPRTETNPPLYHLLLYFWVRLTGSSVFALRFLSLVLGMLTVSLVYRLARLAFGELVGFLAALLCAISPFQVYYSQEARMYALATFFTTLSMFLLARIVSGESPSIARSGSPDPGQKRGLGNPPGAIRSLWIAYFLATAAAIFTHYYALFVVVAQNAFVIALLCPEPSVLGPEDQGLVEGWRRDRGFDKPSATGGLCPPRPKGRLTRWLAVQATLALSFVPWMLAQRGFLGGKASARFDELTLPGLIGIVKRSLVAFSVGTTVEAPLGHYLTLAFLLLVALGLVAAFRRRADGRGVLSPLSLAPVLVALSPCLRTRVQDECQSPGSLSPRIKETRGLSKGRWQTWLLLAWLLIPLACAWLVNPIMPFFQERYLLVIAPAFIILVACGLEWMGARSLWLLVLGLLLVVSASFFSLHNWFFDDAYTKGEYGLMMDYVRDHDQQGDLLLLNNPLQEALFDYYSCKRSGVFRHPPGVPHRFISRHDLRNEQRAAQALAALTEGYSRVWLVMFGYAEQYDPDHLAERWLSEHGYRSSYRSFLGAYLTLYVMSPADASFPMQHTVAANLDNKALLIGYGLVAQEIEAGGALRLTLYWQALAEMKAEVLAKRYTVFVHLLDADNRIVAQMDSEPLGGTHPTTEWQLGEIVRDSYGLLIAPDTPPGEYLLEVGMYYLPTLERLPVLNASGGVEDDRVVLGRIVVR